MLHGSWVLAPMAAAAAIAGGLCWLIRRWSASRRWSYLHMLWLAGGALLAHTAFGAVGVVPSMFDRAGLIVLGLLTIWLLLVLIRRPASRSIAKSGLPVTPCYLAAAHERTSRAHRRGV